MKCTKERFESTSAAFLVNLRFSESKKMFPHSRFANSEISNEPNVSEYMVAKERRVKHHPIWVEAKATLPRSGERRYFSSESIPLSHQLKIGGR
jgi:hypothetical protein